MGIIIDLVLISIIVLNIIIGYKKGLISVVFSICAFFISIIVTLILFKPISNVIINNTEIDDKIREIIISNNNEQPESNIEEYDNNVLERYINKVITDNKNKAKAEVIEIIADNVSQKSVEIITAIVLFVGVRLITVVLKTVLEGLAELPIIKQFNTLGGIIYGIVKSFVIIFIILTILFFVVSINNTGIISNMIETSYVTKFLFTNNIIVNYCLLGKNLL